jgi:aspartyl protease family protein
MSLSTGTRGLIGDMLGWTAIAVVGALALTHTAEIRSIAASLLGLPAVAEREVGAEPVESETAEPPRAPGVELTAGQNGHFFTAAEVNGREIEVLVDTGASLVALTYEDAERAGIYLKSSDFTHGVQTANGVARVAPVTLDKVSIGDISVRNVQAAVSERGRLKTSLLGMSFLGRLGRVDIKSGRLLLEE